MLWAEFETEVAAIRDALADVPESVPMMDAIRTAVVAANHYRAEDVPEMRMRMALIATEPALSFGAAEHYAHWEQAVSDFAARRLGLPAESLYPLAVGRTVLAACRAAYDRWSDRADQRPAGLPRRRAVGAGGRVRPGLAPRLTPPAPGRAAHAPARPAATSLVRL